MAITQAMGDKGAIALPELPREVSSQCTQAICRMLTDLSLHFKWQVLKTSQPLTQVEYIYLHATKDGWAYIGNAEGAVVTLEVTMGYGVTSNSDGLLFSSEPPTLKAFDTVLRSELGFGEDYPIKADQSHQHQLALDINRALKGMALFREELLTPP